MSASTPDLFSPAPDRAPVLTVSELNRRARQAVEAALPLCWVAGEVSNFTRAASGHWYFALKDEHAQVRCVMFRHRSQYLDWRPENGMQVEARAVATLYEARGEFQLTVETLRRAGMGLLFERFERLKAMLVAEGLTDEARKRRLPAFPRALGVVTSTAGAALHDVLTTLARRMPRLPVFVYPTPVQGEGAAAQIAAAIRTAGTRAECDVLLVCRGGGSLEDLWQFNEEVVARAIAASPIPVITGVGHETDFTIADFVSDRRAPTPTAAAELAVPNRADLAREGGHLRARLSRLAQTGVEVRMQRIDGLARRLVHPGERLARQRDQLEQARGRLLRATGTMLDQRHWALRATASRLAAAAPDLALLRQRQGHLADRLTRGSRHVVELARERLAKLAGQLCQLDPEAVLARGYSIVNTSSGEVVSDSGQLAVGQDVALRFHRGEASGRITALMAPREPTPAVPPPARE